MISEGYATKDITQIDNARAFRHALDQSLADHKRRTKVNSDSLIESCGSNPTQWRLREHGSVIHNKVDTSRAVAQLGQQMFESRYLFQVCLLIGH